MHLSRGLPALILASAAAVGATEKWSPIHLPDPRQVELGGTCGEALQHGLERLSKPPYSAEWLLSDVSFRIDRIFTNYSGDVSGRFLELAALTSPPGQFLPDTLRTVAAEVTKYQKRDGHFGFDMDFSKPLQKMSPPIPMLWGNARLLVGLVTAASALRDTNLLAAARRLGDFYVETSGIFCSPSREAELRATGTGGDGYTCCYFPAIESLALLYRATGDQRYLAQARLMAEWFKRFDALPTDHSHGNLCAWRGILELYDITGERSYLDRALAKWQTAVQEGYVWPVGGVGEHWYRFHSGDEGCSESDWLRLNLQLWRFTGETRFLDLAERLLLNQYAGNQCPNGGYGWRPFDGDADGPIGTAANLDEWYFCCSFHGPLGLHYLKSYLATSSAAGIYVNFPFDFCATLANNRSPYRVGLRSLSSGLDDERTFEITVTPLGKTSPKPMTLWLRRPKWASAVRLSNLAGKPVAFSEQDGYLKIRGKFSGGERLRVAFRTRLSLEHRRFQPVLVPTDRVSRWKDVALLDGPDVLYAVPARAPGRLTWLALVEDNGRLRLPGKDEEKFLTVLLPELSSGVRECSAALKNSGVIALGAEQSLRTRRRAAFMHDVIVVPSKEIKGEALAAFSERARKLSGFRFGGGFGSGLETRPDAWLASAGWQFGSNGLHITGGDVGLLDFDAGSDYRFEFDLELPKDGEGITGWVVRAQGTGDCLLFQVQSADSTYNAPQYKTRPNTLRPHMRRYGEWKIAEPVPLPKEVRRGETHHFAVECRGKTVTVFLDSQNIYTGDDGGCTAGTVGFRAAGPVEQGLFRNISLQR